MEIDWSKIPGALVLPGEQVNTQRYVPVAVARERLEAAHKWDAAAALIASDPAVFLKLVTLRAGLDPADAAVRGLLTLAGADPDAILAP